MAHEGTRELIQRCGYGPREPLVVGTSRTETAYVTQGVAGVGVPVTPDAQVYAASLSKQFLGACVALLVRSGDLDLASPLSVHLPGLPPWSRDIEVRHLLFHTSGLAADGALSVESDRTTVGVLEALNESEPLAPPGTEFRYSNAGYVCLAAVVEHASGQALGDLAEQRLFAPLAMTDTVFWNGPAAEPLGALPLRERHPAPLSLGDGGAWSTAPDLLRWAQAMNADALGIADLIDQRGSLDDGAPLDYGWGVGLRDHAGLRVYRHGGGWSGNRLLLARVPALSASLVIIALDDDTERRVALADRLLDLICAACRVRSRRWRPAGLASSAASAEAADYGGGVRPAPRGEHHTWVTWVHPIPG